MKWEVGAFEVDGSTIVKCIEHIRALGANGWEPFQVMSETDDAGNTRTVALAKRPLTSEAQSPTPQSLERGYP